MLHQDHTNKGAPLTQPRERIHFKLALLMYKACTNHLPSYLSSMVTPCSSGKGHSSQHPLESMLFLAHILRAPGTYCRWSLHLEFPTSPCPQFPH